MDGALMPTRDTLLFAEAALRAIGRAEHAGRAPRRLTEAGLETWRRFRGRLDHAHLLRLLIEDAAVTMPLPFDPERLDGADIALDTLGDEDAHDLIKGLADLDQPGEDYVIAQARALGLPSRFARSNLHRVKAHHTIVELPGTGGQIAHHLVSSHDDATLQDNLVVCTASWQEELLAGLVASDLGVLTTTHVRRDPTLAETRESHRHGADFVMGLGPDRGGAFDETRLQTLFPNARIVLV